MALRNGCGTRVIRGAHATTVDGRTWTWSVRCQLYRWCKLGHLEILCSSRCGRIGYWRSLEAAVAWTLGYAEGTADGRSGREKAV